MIENDPAYTATMVLPDLVGRELTNEEAEAAAGGFSFGSIWEKEKKKLLEDKFSLAQSAVSAFLSGKK